MGYAGFGYVEEATSVSAAGARTAATDAPSASDAPSPDGSSDDTIERVEITLPSDPSYLALLRSSGAALGARLDFTLDEIEDLRIAVDEAGALLLTRADFGAPLRCAFGIGLDELTIEVSVRSAAPSAIDRSSFAWTVLEALAGPVEVRAADGEVRLLLRKSRQDRL